MVIRAFRRFLVLSIFVLPLLVCSTALAATLDFDGDGETDPALMELQNDNSENTMVWHILNSTDELERLEFGNHGDGDWPVPADFDGDGNAEMALLRANRDDNVLNWRVRFGADDIQDLDFGVPGNHAIYGCDLDGDGADDLVVINKKTVSFRDFGDEDASSFTLSRGRHKKFGCADVNGDGADDLISLRQKKRRKRGRIVKLLLFNAWSADGTQLIRNRKFGGNKKTEIFALDFNGNGYAELGFLRRARNKGVAVVNVAGTSKVKITFEGLTFGPAPFVIGTIADSEDNLVPGIIFRRSGGTFFKMTLTDLEPEEIDVSGIDNDAGLSLLRNARVINTKNDPSGGADDSNDSGGGDSGGGDSGGGDSGGTNPPPAGLAGVCPNGVTDLRSPNLWKPKADAGDSRLNKPALLLRDGYKSGTPSSLKLYASNGAEICSMGYKASSIQGVNGGAKHYFSGWPGGCYESASVMAQRAIAQTGSTEFYSEWRGGVCLGPIADPRQRQE